MPNINYPKTGFWITDRPKLCNSNKLKKFKYLKHKMYISKLPWFCLPSSRAQTKSTPPRNM